MRTVSEVIMDLSGNGLAESGLLELSAALTQLADAKWKISEHLSDFLDKEELDEILLMVERPSQQQILASSVIECLAPKQKEYYLMHTIENKSIGQIAKEFGVAKGSVQWSIDRAKQKIEMVKDGYNFTKGKHKRFLPKKE